MKALTIIAGQYRGSHKGEAPPNVEALKAHIKKNPTALQVHGIDAGSADAMFTSSRDGKPFVYRPSKGKGIPTPGPDGKTNQPVIFYEAEGSGGSRWVAYELGGTELVGAAQFKQLVPEVP